MKATTAGWTPHWFSQYRFYLSVLVGTCILGTLFGVNYLGPTTNVALANNFSVTGGRSSVGFMESSIRKEYESTKSKVKKYVPADAEYWTEEGRDGFVMIMKKPKNQNPDDDGDGESEGNSGSQVAEEGD